MTAEQLKKANEIAKAIDDYRSHLDSIGLFACDRLAVFNTSRVYIDLRFVDMLPINVREFVVLYLDNIKSKIKQLELEFEAL